MSHILTVLKFYNVQNCGTFFGKVRVRCKCDVCPVLWKQRTYVAPALYQNRNPSLNIYKSIMVSLCAMKLTFSNYFL